VPWEVYLACATADGIDANTLHLLKTSLDINDLYDLIEMQWVNGSWMEAIQKNAESRAAQEAEMKAALGGGAR